jgi:centromeric protein E
MSDGLISVSSPTQSRSSSAQDSYSTSATNYDDEGTSHKRDTTMSEDHRASKSFDGKGNVLVSVRVRPDAGANDHKAEGEWMVDGRKSLIAYRGKEGGDYYYGMNKY